MRLFLPLHNRNLAPIHKLFRFTQLVVGFLQQGSQFVGDVRVGAHNQHDMGLGEADLLVEIIARVIAFDEPHHIEPPLYSRFCAPRYCRLEQDALDTFDVLFKNSGAAHLH